MIIGLSGRKQAGKNAVAKLLAVWARGKRIVEVSFAAKLKQSVAALLDCSLDDIETWKNDPHVVVCVGTLVDGLGIIEIKTQTFRSFLQRYGTEAHRDVFGDNFWVDAALPIITYGDGSVDTSRYDDALYVVTDARFPNEADRIRALGGEVVRVVGPPEIEQAEDGHASETPLPDELVDRTILNTKRDDNYAALDLEVRHLLRDLTTKE